VSPMELGGFKSDEYLAVNPQGKVPSLRCEVTGLCIAESDTVSRYLLSEFAHVGPSFQPNDPTSNAIARFHDMYLTSIQGCLYKAVPPFGAFGSRKDALKEYSEQLYKIADLMDDTGPYMCGTEVSLSDATVFPSIVFASFMFPKIDSGIEQPIPPKIENWFKTMIESDAAFKKVYDEVSAFRGGFAISAKLIV
jgi:glutathione S-transferase